MLRTLMRLVTLSGILISCGGDLPKYKTLKRCTIDNRFDICECAIYDFNTPQIITEYESFSVNDCIKQLEVFHAFEVEAFTSSIVETRKKRKFLEDAKSKKDLKKRIKSL